MSWKCFCTWLKGIVTQALSTGFGAFLGALLVWLSGLTVAEPLDQKALNAKRDQAWNTARTWEQEGYAVLVETIREECFVTTEPGWTDCASKQPFSTAWDEGIIGTKDVRLLRVEKAKPEDAPIEAKSIPRVRPRRYQLEFNWDQG